MLDRMKSYQEVTEVTNFWYTTYTVRSGFFTCTLSAILNISSLSTGCNCRITNLQVNPYSMSFPSSVCVYVWCVYACVWLCTYLCTSPIVANGNYFFIYVNLKNILKMYRKVTLYIFLESIQKIDENNVKNIFMLPP
ncbi:small integral membrane protein 14 [Columba livia]|uniref:Small integral membrane protein 14 n=1 Tax=Columba livia TaxID=8932 RepID=A0A2I0MLY1_COLLI|nr:small integral membrane protein 14 [Columba livia]